MEIITILLLTVFALGLGLWFGGQGGTLPPGPKPKPIIGNMHQFPKENRHMVFDEWHKAYGPLVGLKLGLKSLILIGKHDLARELLDRRGAIYSSRPRLVMANEIANRGYHTSLLPYGPRWRLHNRVHSAILSPRIVQHYHSLQDIESVQLVHDLLSATSSDFGSHMDRYSSSLIFALAYGKRLLKSDVHEIKENEDIVQNFIENVATGQWLVDTFPILNYLPSFLAPWKKIGDSIYNRKFEMLKHNTAIALGKNTWNWTKHFHGAKMPKDATSEELLNIIGVLYEAGADTTTSALETFVMASVLHPSCVKQAQKEIDALVGRDKLPSFEDIQKLPYVNAFIEETMRWRPISRQGMPHCTTADDEYMGYFIPKGSILIPNQWQMAMDQDTFGDPTVFRPERWLEDPKLPISTFGFGRRACPARYIAMNSMRIVVCRLLWAYDFEHAYNDGKRVEINSLDFFSDGILSKPTPFQAILHVRSSEHTKAIKQAYIESEKDEKKILSHIGTAFA